MTVGLGRRYGRGSGWKGRLVDRMGRYNSGTGVTVIWTAVGGREGWLTGCEDMTVGLGQTVIWSWQWMEGKAG